MLSGMTLNEKRLYDTPLVSTALDRGKKLITPYFWMSFIMYPVWFITYKIIASTKATIFQMFKGILYSNDAGFEAGTSNALWFLLTLFLAIVLYAALVKLSKNNDAVMTVSIVLCAIIGYLEAGKHQVWHFNVAFTAVVFMYIGNRIMKLYHSNREWFDSRRNPGKYILILILCAVGYFAHKQNGRISMAANKFGESVLLYYISALAFSFAIILAVIILPRISLFEYVGKNTLLYVGFHVPFIRIFERAFPEIKESVPVSLILGIGVYLAMIPVCAVFNRFFPYVCSKTPLKGRIGGVEAGKYFIAYVSLIIPVYGVYQKLGLSLSKPVTAIAVAGATVFGALVFTIIANRFFPFIYLQDKKSQ